MTATVSKEDLTTLRKAIGVARSIESQGGQVDLLVDELERLLMRIDADRVVHEEV